MGERTMRAVRWHGRHDVRYETVPLAPAPGPGEIRVRVAWCGLCGSDLHEYLSGPFQIPERTHAVTGRAAPITLGHEISGRVVDAGGDVTVPEVGDLVALNALLPCGTCRPCARGDVHLCAVLGHLGMSADGGLAELVTVPAGMAVRVPPHVPADVAALAEPFAVAVHLVRQAGSIDDALVVGAGTIGLATALLLRDKGVEPALVDLAAPRLAHARALGFTAYRPGELDAELPLVFECSGAPQGVDTAIRRTEPGGRVVLAGLPAAPSPVDVASVVLRELRLVGSMSHLVDTDLRPAVDFLATHADEAARLATARVPLADTVPGGLDVLAGTDRGQHAKILVQVG